MNEALALLIALTSLAAAPAKEPAPPASDVTYTVPAGWDRVEKDRVVTLTPPGTAADKCSVVLTPGEPLKGDFSAWFNTRWDDLRGGAKVVQGGGRTGQPNGPNGSYFNQAALLESPGSDGGPPVRSGLLLYAVHIGDSVHSVVFRTDGPKLFNEHKKTVNRFLAGLQFYDTRSESRRRPPAPSKPRPAEPGSRD